mgnify:CR=1 FL=1
MQLKKIIFPCFVFLCMGTIFLFSHQNGNKSERLSDDFVLKIIKSVTEVSKTEVSEIRKVEIVQKTRFLIRKGAHFFLYFLLGFLSYLTFKVYHFKHPLFLAIFFCLIYASSDEIHQLFVNARTGRVLDVLIDMCGSFSGIAISLFLCHFWMQIKNKKLTTERENYL